MIYKQKFDSSNPQYVAALHAFTITEDNLREFIDLERAEFLLLRFYDMAISLKFLTRVWHKLQKLDQIKYLKFQNCNFESSDVFIAPKSISSVEHLIVESMSFENIGEQTLAQIINGLPDLTSISISNLHSFSNFVHIVESLSQLKNLSFFNIRQDARLQVPHDQLPMGRVFQEFLSSNRNLKAFRVFNAMRGRAKWACLQEVAANNNKLEYISTGKMTLTHHYVDLFDPTTIFATSISHNFFLNFFASLIDVRVLDMSFTTLSEDFTIDFLELISQNKMRNLRAVIFKTPKVSVARNKPLSDCLYGVFQECLSKQRSLCHVAFHDECDEKFLQIAESIIEKNPMILSFKCGQIAGGFSEQTYKLLIDRQSRVINLLNMIQNYNFKLGYEKVGYLYDLCKTVIYLDIPRTPYNILPSVEAKLINFKDNYLFEAALIAKQNVGVYFLSTENSNGIFIPNDVLTNIFKYITLSDIDLSTPVKKSFLQEVMSFF